MTRKLRFLTLPGIGQILIGLSHPFKRNGAVGNADICVLFDTITKDFEAGQSPVDLHLQQHASWSSNESLNELFETIDDPLILG